MPCDPYFHGKWFTFRTINPTSSSTRAAKLLASLTPTEAVHLLATLTLLEQGLAGGRNFAGRTQKVRGSKLGLIELKPSRPGRPGANLRLYALVCGRTVWLVDGFRKTSPDVERFNRRAESAAARWLESRAHESYEREDIRGAR